MGRPPEIIPVFRLIQPGPLTGFLAGCPTVRFGAVFLLAPVSVIGTKGFATVQADKLLALFAAQELTLLCLRQAKKAVTARQKKRKKGRKRKWNKKELLSSLSEEDPGIRYKQFQTGIIMTYSGWRSHPISRLLKLFLLNNWFPSGNSLFPNAVFVRVGPSQLIENM